MPAIPWEDVWVKLQTLIGPTAGASLALMLVLRLASRERFSYVAAVLAVVGAAVAGDIIVKRHFDKDAPFHYSFDPARSDSWRDYRDCWSDYRDVFAWSLENQPKENEENPREDPPRKPSRTYWLPWLAALAILIELAARMPRVPVGLIWTLRTLTAIVAGRLLTYPDARVETPWLPWTAAAAFFLQWIVVSELAKRWKDGVVPLAVAASLACASVILIHAHSELLTDMALLGFAALVGPTVVAWLLPSDSGAALAGAALFLPALLLVGHQETYSKVPWRSFLCAALAPLVLVLFLLPYLNRLEGWKRRIPALILPLIFAVYAVYVAMQYETLEL